MSGFPEHIGADLFGTDHKKKRRRKGFPEHIGADLFGTDHPKKKRKVEV